MSSIHEECGVFGIMTKQPEDVASMVYFGLYSLQHRGQESCGIVVNDDGIFVSHKDVGLVSEVFNSSILQSFPKGTMAVGHTRYGTTGGTNRNNCQPIEVNHQKGHMALAHNGNLVNADEIRKRFELSGAIFHGTSDTEAIAHTIVANRLKCKSTEDAVVKTMREIKGAYSCVLMTATKLIAFRDPNGFRPLCLGTFPDGATCFSSESCALDSIGATFVRDLLPGAIVVVSRDGIQSIRTHCTTKKTSSM